MLITYNLNLQKSIDYARKWALSRNPAYYNFDPIGGDCTNFISQCLYAGDAVMNMTRDVGWYYISQNDRAAAWTGVEYFYTFMTQNQGVGPFGSQIPLQDVRVGDILQLGGYSGRFYHTLLVVSMQGGEPHIAAHTNNAWNVPLSAYRYDRIRCLRIDQARKYG
ncbi:MAG: amidase domain-containing protein [Clostridia bacterium]|nr:amidase domain-containing protein [Clostridia bacterium]